VNLQDCRAFTRMGCSSLLACFACGCAIAPTAEAEAEADKLRDLAMQRFEAGDRRSALEFNAKALALTAHLPASSWRTVENYDDAGLYHYGSESWMQSARHQAIAVLLACGAAENAPMYAAYVERLGWAFAKYRPAMDFRPIAADPLILLRDEGLGLRDNADLRRRFFVRYAAPNASRSSRPHYVFRLRADAPTSCGVKTAPSSSGPGSG
jgi:hypothetical protein